MNAAGNVRLTYIANARLPTEKAHGLQIVRMCEAFEQVGATVTLLHPTRHQPGSLQGVEPLEHYDVERRFMIHRLPNIDVVRAESWLPAQVYTAAFFIHSSLWAAYAVSRATALVASDVFFTRDISVAAALQRRGLPTVLELHQAPARWSLRVLRRVARHPSLRVLVTMTHALGEVLASQGIAMPRSLVLHDGVDLARHRAARPEGLGRDGRPVVLYTGHLFPEKGIDTLVEAARRLPRASVMIAGGMPRDVNGWRARIAREGPENVEFLGYLAPERIAGLQKGADVLVLPNSGRHRHSSLYTSPMKLFEYMAAGRPIVASDVPAIREVLTHEANAWLTPPDDAQALARAIESMLNDRPIAVRLARQAELDVERYSWNGRAAAILQAAGFQPSGLRRTAGRC